MNNIILDTTFLIALLDEKDIWHNNAVSLRDTFIEKNMGLLFLDCVINETFTVLGKRCERKNERT